jgi:hypothetical protein
VLPTREPNAVATVTSLLYLDVLVFRGGILNEVATIVVALHKRYLTLTISIFLIITKAMLIPQNAKEVDAGTYQWASKSFTSTMSEFGSTTPCLMAVYAEIAAENTLAHDERCSIPMRSVSNGWMRCLARE